MVVTYAALHEAVKAPRSCTKSASYKSRRAATSSFVGRSISVPVALLGSSVPGNCYDIARKGKGVSGGEGNSRR